MNNFTDVRWTLHDRDVVLQCITFSEHYNGTKYIPLDAPEVEIIEGEYADGQPLSRGDFEELSNDNDLCAYVEGGGNVPVDEIIRNLQGEAIC